MSTVCDTMTSLSTRAACRTALEALARRDVSRAEEILADPLAAEPNDPNLLYLWGNCALVRGDDSLALERYARALAAAPDFPAVLLNVGFLHRRHHRLVEARSALERCVALAPEDVAAWVNLVATYVNEGEPERGETVAREALRRHPRSALARWNLSLLLLEQGRYEEGFREYRHRFAAGVVAGPRFAPGAAPPRLESLDDLRPGDSIACHGEQGLGDEILFSGMLAECARMVADRGATLLLDCHPRLRRAFERAFDLPVLPRGPGGEPTGSPPDWILPIGDLGAFFRTRAGDFPDHGGYLVVDQARVAAIRRELADGRSAGTPLVGLAWSGGSPYTHGLYRHIPLAEWLPLFRLPATFVSLEYRETAGEIAAAVADHGVRLVDASGLAAAWDYDDVLHLVAALDHVVSVPTSVLHAAGAVGIPCSIVMHARAAWRECSADNRIPWYPRTHRRFVRGKAEESWRGTIERVASSLAGRLGAENGG